jgi:3-phenylpropionate/trans-cinnamate dioxygenase ferredoxin reductase subunit
MNPHIVIVGAGHAGGTAAVLLRQFGYQGEITMIGEEPFAPYQRPPLSKAYLKGAVQPDTLKLRPESYYTDNKVDARFGTSVAAIRRDSKTVLLSTGETIAYDWLILATGCEPRHLVLDGAEPAKMHVLRDLADAERLKAAIVPGARLAIIGGGYVGLEVAASAVELGAHPVVLEREDRILARVASPPLSAFFHDYHQARGVEILTGAQIQRFHDHALHLADGRAIGCDQIVVGIGADPRDKLAREAGLTCERGIVVDTEARTSDPHIFAIGDVTWRPMPLYGHRMFRLESVPNALEQAKQAVSVIVGRPAPNPEVPWFWSDQFALKLQIAGVPFETDRLVLRGDMAAGRFALFHLQQGRVVAVEAVNSPPEFMAGKMLIEKGTPVDPDRLADVSVPMKELAA